jgi:tagaturonate reductase
MNHLSETVLQFGSGRFLRGFADFFIEQANRAGRAFGRVVVVQTTGEERALALNRQGGRYHVLVRGLENGVLVDRVEESGSISTALVATRQWDEVRAAARSSQLRYVLSNTAEEGYKLHPEDGPTDAPPRSFPAKLLLVLRERFEVGQPGVTVLPCELFEHNADLLLNIVRQLAQKWQLPDSFQNWLRQECRWLNALVDRIVTDPPPDQPRPEGDALAVMAEPFALWAIEVKDGKEALFPHPAITFTSDVQPYFLRKVRILNAAHTALVNKARPRGHETVQQAMRDSEISAWLQRLLFDEIVPTLAGRVEGPAEFARQTLERFRNPFLAHKLSDIAAYHESKVKIRLLPTRAEFIEKFGRSPALLDEAIGGGTVS